MGWRKCPPAQPEGSSSNRRTLQSHQLSHQHQLYRVLTSQNRKSCSLVDDRRDWHLGKSSELVVCTFKSTFVGFCRAILERPLKMTPLLTLLLLFLRTIESRHIVSGQARLSKERTALGTELNREAGELTQEDFVARVSPHHGESITIKESINQNFDKPPKRIPRGAKDGSPKKRDQHSPHNYRHPRPYDPDGYFTTPSSAHNSDGAVRGNSSNKGTVLLHNPLYPVTESSYGAYTVMLLALILFAVGIVGNLALMCIVWHNYYLKSAWNCILASLAFWDFLVLFFCLPVVIFNELTTKRLLGDLSCRLVPYLEVREVILCQQKCTI